MGLLTLGFDYIDLAYVGDYFFQSLITRLSPFISEMTNLLESHLNVFIPSLPPLPCIQIIQLYTLSLDCMQLSNFDNPI